MTKLCLLLVCVLTVATIVTALQGEEDSSLTEELAYSRVVRSPEAKKRRGSKFRGKARKSKRRGKKAKRRRSKKGNRSSRRSKKTQSGSRLSGRTVSDTCLETSMTIMRMWKDIISNFEKQKKRMEKQNGTGASKKDKKGLFSPIALRLIEAGGGNKSGLTCGGAADNDGAKQLKNLTDTLTECETEIVKVCDPANIPQPNATKLAECDDLATKFKTGAQECLDKSIGATKTDTTEACNCWTSTTLDGIVQAAKTCKFPNEAKAIAGALKNCTKAFGKCRKFEDDAITAITACNSDSSKLASKVTE